jgi:hypothetical protein
VSFRVFKEEGDQLWKRCLIPRYFFRFPVLTSAALGAALSAVASPFCSEGLQPAVAARDHQIALLEYKLRCAEADMDAMRRKLARHTEQARRRQLDPLRRPSDADGAEEAEDVAADGGPDATATSQAWAAADEADGVRVSRSERRTINALVRRYLLARGYGATAIALAEEAPASDLPSAEEEAQLLALPGSTGGNGTRMASLLQYHRQRMGNSAASAGPGGQAPASGSGVAAGDVGQLMSDLRGRDEEVRSLRDELSAVHGALEAVTADLSAARRSLSALEQELMLARTTRGAGAGAAAQQQQTVAATAKTAATAAAAPSAAPAGAPVASVQLSFAPFLLRAVADCLPGLSQHMVTKHRASLVPVLAAAAAADASLDGRRALIDSLLTTIRRPSHAERCLIATQVAVLADRLGPQAAEVELVPELMRLAKAGKTKERKALAAALCGALAASVSDKRCDTLLAVLSDLADSEHAIVRVGVVEGLTGVARTLSSRWADALKSGAVQGANTALEQFSSRQFRAIEDLMWRCVLHSVSAASSNTAGRGSIDLSAGSAGSATARDDTEMTELAAAAATEFPLGITPLVALHGTHKHTEYLAKRREREHNRNVEDPAPLSFPAHWGVVPPAVSATVAASLLPTLVHWAHKLNLLFSSFVPGTLSLLVETLHTAVGANGAIQAANLAALAASAAPVATDPNARRGSLGPVASVEPSMQQAFLLGLGRAAQSVRLGDWHQRRVQFVLAILAAMAPLVRECVLEEGCSVSFNKGFLDAQASAIASATAVRKQSDVGSIDDSHGADHTNAVAASGDVNAVSLFDHAAFQPGDVCDVFDFLSASNVQTFPPEKAIAGLTQQQQPHVGFTQRQALLLTALLRGTAAARKRTKEPDLASGPAWVALKDEMVTVQWPSLRFVIRSLVPSLLRQVACVNRSSQAGRVIVDSYAEALNALCVAFGPAFTSYVVRPMFLRAFGIAVDIPPAIPAGQTGYTGREPGLSFVQDLLLGQSAAVQQAVAPASTSGAPANNAAPVKGADWPFLLPELAWLHRDSPDNPSNWGGRSVAKPAPESGAPGTGGVWNAEPLLSLYGSGVLACQALSPREHLEHSLRAMIVLVSTNRMGWGQAQTALEDAVMRAGGGNSLTGSSHGTTGAGHGRTNTGTAVAAAAGVSVAVDKRTVEEKTGSLLPPGAHAQVLAFMLGDVFMRASSASDPAIRACVANLYRSLTPLLTGQQIKDYFMPTVKRLSADTTPVVALAAVRAVANVYSTAASNDTVVRAEVNSEIHRLLRAGPKEVVVEVLRALMRAVPNAAPALRDGFILDRLIELSTRLVEAANAGAEALRDFCATVGDVAPGDVHSAAAQAARQARAAAVQAHEPWPKAKLEDLEEVAMAVCEVFRSFGTCVLSPDIKGIARETAMKLLRTDILDATYRDVMLSTIDTLFPAEQQQQLTAGGYADADGYSGASRGEIAGLQTGSAADFMTASADAFAQPFGGSAADSHAAATIGAGFLASAGALNPSDANADRFKTEALGHAAREMGHAAKEVTTTLFKGTKELFSGFKKEGGPGMGTPSSSNRPGPGNIPSSPVAGSRTGYTYETPGGAGGRRGSASRIGVADGAPVMSLASFSGAGAATPTGGTTASEQSAMSLSAFAGVSDTGAGAPLGRPPMAPSVPPQSHQSQHQHSDGEGDGDDEESIRRSNSNGMMSSVSNVNLGMGKMWKGMKGMGKNLGKMI